MFAALLCCRSILGSSVSSTHVLFSHSLLRQLRCLFSDSCSDCWGPSAFWKQHQTCGKGSCVWTDPQDPDQEGEQPLLWWGALKSSMLMMHMQWHSLNLAGLFFIFADVFLQCSYAAIRSVWKPHQLQGRYTCRFWVQHKLLYPSKLLVVFLLRRCIIPIHWGPTVSWENSR